MIFTCRCYLSYASGSYQKHDMLNALNARNKSTAVFDFVSNLWNKVRNYKQTVFEAFNAQTKVFQLYDKNPAYDQ